MAKVLSHAEPKTAQASSTEPEQEPTTKPDGQRGPVCLFCSKPDGPFEDEEHVVPKSLGNNADYGLVPWEIVIPPGEVCDPCNHGPLAKLDKALAEWPPISILRSLWQVRNRKNKLPDAARGTRWAFAQSEDDPRLFAMRAIGDISERTGRDDIARAMCKIALETQWLRDPEDARSARWDPIRLVALGGPLPSELDLRADFGQSIDDIDPAPAVQLQTTHSHLPLGFRCGAIICGQPLLANLGEPNTRVPRASLGDSEAVWTVGPDGHLTGGPNSMVVVTRGAAETARRLGPEEGPPERTGPDTANLPTGDKRFTVHLSSERPRRIQREDFLARSRVSHRLLLALAGLLAVIVLALAL